MTKYICFSHPNIALIKYWGKKDDKEILPIHSSLSVTLDFGTTRTEISRSEDVTTFTLNNEKSELTQRMVYAMDIFRSKHNFSEILIESSNSFPTSAGFASSASGASAFVGSLASYIGETDQPIEYWKERNIDLSMIARVVSGSGCRSIYGGFVEWKSGNEKTSIAEQVFDKDYWKDFVGAHIILDSKKKKVPSTSAMRRSVETVPWIMWRAKEVVPKRVEESKSYIKERDFGSLAEVIMKESNELHSNCLATYPPVVYLNDMSHNVISSISDINSRFSSPIAAYSFDAGPNPFIFTTEDNYDYVISELRKESGLSISNVMKTRPADGIRIKIE